MPVECSIEDGLVIVRQSGVTTMACLRDAFTQILKEPGLRDERLLILWDGRAAAPSKPSETVRRAISRMEAYPRLAAASFALVVGSELQFGMARLSQVHMEFAGVNSMVFRSVDEATNWLVSQKTALLEPQ